MMKKWLEMYAATLKSLGAFALCFVMLFAIMGAVCLPVNAYAESESDMVDDTGALLRTESNIALFADITFDPPLPEDGSYLDPNQRYIFHFDVDEAHAKGVQTDGGKVDFLFSPDYMYYPLPKGLDYTLTIPHNGKLQFYAMDYQKNEQLLVTADVSIETQSDGTELLLVTWNQDAPGWYLLQIATNAKYTLEVQAALDNSEDVIDLGDDKKYYTDNTARASFTKTINPADLRTKLTEDQKKDFQFTLQDVYVAKTPADGDTVDAKGFVRDAQGNIVYEGPQDVTIDLSQMKWDNEKGHYYYDFPQKLKPTGESVVVTENDRPTTLAGYTWNEDSSVIKATSAEKLTGGSHRIVSLVNVYTEDQAKLKISKAFGADSDIKAADLSTNDKKNIKFSVQGTKANGDAYGPVVYTYADLEGKNWEIDLPAGTYRVTETASITNHDWTVSYQAGVSSGNGLTEKITGTTANTGNVKVDAGETGAFNFTNTYVEHLGSISLNKTVSGLELTDAQKADTKFTIKKGNTELKWTKDGNNYIYDPAGTVTAIPYSAFVNGAVTLSGLPVGTYNVTEANPDIPGYKRTTQVSVNSGSAKNGTSADVGVTKGQTANVAFTNTYAENASINVEKSVTGALGLNDVNSTLKFKLERNTATGWTTVYDNVSLTNGKISWNNLPFGEYRVTEIATAKPNYSMSTTVAVNPSEGAVVDNNNKEATFELSATSNSATTTFTNNYTPKTTELTINKSLVGSRPDGATDSIKFTVKNGSTTLRWNKTADNEYTYNANGDVTQIPYGETITLKGLHAGNTYTVTESAGTFTGYIITTTANGSTGTSASVKLEEVNGNVNSGTVDFVNTYRPVAEINIDKTFTGVLSNDYVNSEILPKLRFVVSTTGDNNATLYRTESGTWVADKTQAKEFTYTELSTGLELDANKTYYIEELNAEVAGFTVSTWWTQGTGGNPTQVTNGNLPNVTVTAGQKPTISFINDYRADGEIIGKSVQLHTKTWAGLEETEETAVKAAVRFKLEYKDGDVWKTYDTYTLGELTSGMKSYPAPDDTTEKLPISLPAGQYRLTELEYEVSGYDHEVFITVVENGQLNHAETTLMADKQVEFTVTNGNTYQFGLANVYTPKGALEVKKNIVGVDEEDRQKNITFKLSRKLGEDGEPEEIETFSLANFSNGVYTKSGLSTGDYVSDETGKWDIIPYIYIVEETGTHVEHHTLVSTTVKVNDGEASEDSSAEVSLEKGTTASVTVEFTNTYSRSKGNLTVEKTIVGDVPEADADKITFQLKTNGGTVINWDEVDGENVFVDGNIGKKSSFTYADMTDGKFTIKELNTGTYKLVETNADIPGYKRTTVFSVAGNANESGGIQIAAAETANVTVTNTYAPIGSLKVTKKIAVEGNGFANAADLGNLRNIWFDVYAGEGTGTWLGGFDLWGNTNNTNVQFAAGDLEVNQISATEWEFSRTMVDLQPGTYTIVENITAVNGYQHVETTVTGAAQRIADVDGKPAFKVVVTSNGGVTIAAGMVNSYKEQGKLSVSKTLSGIDLSKLTDAQKNSIVFGLFDDGNVLIPAKDGDAIASGEYQGWVPYAKMANGVYTWENLDVSKQYYIKEFVIGEDNANTATGSTFYGYIHTQTSWSGAASGSTTSVPGVVETAPVSVNKDGVQISFTNAYEAVNRLSATKAAQNYSSDLVNEDHLPVWHFTVTVNNVGAASMSNNQTVLTDVFDAQNKEWFKLVEEEAFRPSITHGDHVALEAKDNGDGTAEYVLKLQEGAPASQTVIISYYLQPQDYATFQEMLQDTKHKTTSSSQGATWTYTNTITYYPLPNEAPESISADYFYNTDMVTKTMTSSPGNLNVTFTLNINPDALYIGQNDRLIVLDKMSDNVEVNMSSFVVSPEDQAANVNVSLYQESEDWDIQIEVPNGVALTITYKATIKEPTGNVHVTNTVSMEGVIQEVEGDVEFEGGNSGSMSVGAISIFKHGDTMTIPLQGATFALYQCEDSSLTPLSAPLWQADFTSNENGIVAVQSWEDDLLRDYALQWNILYYLVEKSAPEGYELSEPNNPIYFRIYENEADKVEGKEYYYKTGTVFERSNASFAEDVVLTANKTLNGKTLAENQFSFQLLDSEGHVLQTKQNAADGTVTFDAMTYTYERFSAEEKAAGQQVHTYTIKEVNDNAAGYDYDPAEYQVTVTVSVDKNDAGKITGITATPVYTLGGAAASNAAFTNDYNAQGSASFAGTKTLVNASKINEQFSFQIKEGDAVLATVNTQTVADGNTATIPYPTFKYVVDPDAADDVLGAKYDANTNTITVTAKTAEEIAKTYTYSISEVKGETAGIVYDADVYTYTVTVSDNGNGTLNVQGALTGAETASFENEYYGSLGIQKNVTIGDKAPDGSTLADGSYTFTVYEDAECTTVAKDKAGNELVAILVIENGESAGHVFTDVIPGTYWVKETKDTNPSVDLIATPVVITVSGDSEAEVPVAEITNNLGVGDLSLTKTVTGTDAKDVDFSFLVTVAETANESFTMLRGEDESTVTFNAENQLTVTLKAGETVTIKGLPANAAYTVVENEPASGYDAGTLTAGTGTITAGETVAVSQENIYSAVGEVELKATKVLTGNPYTGDPFQFVLSGCETTGDNNVLDGTAAAQSVEQNGTVTWKIKYTATGTYTYTITETEGSFVGMTYDTVVRTVKVDVTDNGDGTLTADVSGDGTTYDATTGVTITNIYREISFQPKVTKKLAGENAPADETFTFVLAKKDGTEVERVTVTGAAEAQFKAITVNEKGVYEYTITEVDGNTPGMSYDTTAYAVKADVQEAADGALSVTLTYGADDAAALEVTNTYSTVKKAPYVKKALSGNTDLYTGTEAFNFTLTRKSAPEGAAAFSGDTASCTLAEGIANFGEITYTVPGTYVYEIVEVEPETKTPGMAYSEQVITYTVVIAQADNAANTLTVASETYTDVNGGTLDTITNQYSEVHFAPEAKKKIDATTEYELADEDFTFVLTTTLDNGTAHTETKIVKNNEKALFGDIVYHVPGTYTITIEETEPEEKTPGMTYSKEKVICTVTVNRAVDGTLTLAKEYEVNGDYSNIITNVFNQPAGQATLNAKKLLSGNDKAYGEQYADVEYTFELTIEENSANTETNNVLANGVETKDVKVGDTASWTIKYDLPGTYTYTIKEIAPKDMIPGMVYDTKEYTVVVEMDYAEEGMNLEPKSITYNGDEDASALEITNLFSEISFQPKVVKAVTDTGLCVMEETFTFELVRINSEAEEQPQQAYAVVARVDGDENTILYSEAVFGEFTYNEPGTYEYEIVELAPEEGKGTPGMTYSDEVVYYTVVVVKDEATGELTIDSETYTGGSVDAQTGDANVITNTYIKPDGMTLIMVKKMVTGNLEQELSTGTLELYDPSEKFAFTLEQTTEVITPSETNDVVVLGEMTQEILDGKMAVWGLTYDQPGVYTYTIKETAGETAGMEYDETVYNVTVTVEYNETESALVTTVSYEDVATLGEMGEMLITNKYSAITFEPEIEKTMVGEKLLEDTFHFMLTQVEPKAEDPFTQKTNIHITPAVSLSGKAVFTDLPVYHEAGTYVYEIVELKPEETEDRTPGMTYSPETVIYTVVVVRDEATGTLSVESETYETVNKIILDEEVTEEAERVEGKIFTNQYKRPEGSAEIFVNKAMTGNEYNGDNKFAFKLTKVEPEAPVDPDEPTEPNEPPMAGTPVDPDTPVVDDPESNNIITPSEVLAIGVGETASWTIKYDQVGTYYYTIEELCGGEDGVTYDETIYNVTVIVEYHVDENGDRMSLDTTVIYGDLTEDDQEPSDEKDPTEEGKDPTEEGEAPDEEGDGSALIPGGGIANPRQADGTLNGDDTTDDEGDVNDGAGEGGTVGGGEGKPEEPGEGTEEEPKPGLTITNKYSRVSFIPEISKIVKGYGVPAEIFTFELVETTEGSNYTDIARCGKDETAVFNEIVYHKPGQYTYEIYELEPNYKTPGMTYSDEIVYLTVMVEMDEVTGALTMTASYTDNGEIINSYTPPVTYDYKFSFTKKWQGGVEASLEWTLYNPDGTVAHKKFNKDIISENEWYYEAWFATDKDYYIIEDVPEGYTPIYINVGEFADVTDRLHNGGTIINYKAPQTGDEFSVLPLVGMMLGSASILAMLFIWSIKRRKAM